MLASNNSVVVYWEKQGSDKLCGLHALNAILQGPFYNEFQLAEIALELNSREAALLGRTASNSGNAHTSNVDGDGNFSIQVLAEALKRVNELACVSIDSESVNKEDLAEENGFICNSSEHWLSIRKINNKWYNLNSTNKEGPEFISDFYLSAFMNSVRENGYQIFVVQGDFPQYDKSYFGEVAKHQIWFTEKQCEELHQRNLKKKNHKLNIGGTDERDMEEAIKRSLGDYGGGAMDEEEQLKKAMEESMKDNFKEDSSDFASRFSGKQEEPEKKFDAFKGQGVSLSAQPLSNDLEGFFAQFSAGFGEDADPEYALAIKMSLKDNYTTKPKAEGDNFSLNMRLPNGKVDNWVFHKGSPVQNIYEYLASTYSEFDKFRVSFGFPRKQLTALGLGIEDAGIENEDTLYVEKI